MGLLQRIVGSDLFMRLVAKSNPKEQPDIELITELMEFPHDLVCGVLAGILQQQMRRGTAQKALLQMRRAVETVIQEDRSSDAQFHWRTLLRETYGRLCQCDEEFGSEKALESLTEDEYAFTEAISSVFAEKLPDFLEQEMAEQPPPVKLRAV